MFFNCFGQFNMGWMNGGFNNMFFPQPFYFNNFMPFQMPNFNMPLFNFMPTFPQFSSNWGVTPVFKTNNFFTTDTFERTTSPLEGYNISKGTLLANIAQNRAIGKSGHCAKFVQEAINLAGLGACTGVDAYAMPNTLRFNPNFKEISKDTDVNTLPAGCILVYDKCVRASEEIYGHTEITLGDKRGVSDGISETLNPNPSAIFIPV